MQQDFISVIFTTYNQPKWLEKVLWGYECQTHKNFEIVIADDGSKNETERVIKSFIKKGSLNIKHIWHPDEGYQKCTILNKAIAASKSNYLIFSDGDCVPRKDFIEEHLKQREPGYFLSGGAIRLPLKLSHYINKKEIYSQKAFNINWATKNGLTKNIKSTKLIQNKFFSKLMNTITPAKATWNGGNASTWRRHIEKINGFNEEMLYGGQDREFGERLFNYGLKSKQIRHTAICLHLEHGRLYKTKKSIQKNKKIRAEIKKRKNIYTNKGLHKYINNKNQ
ncbi:glycosyltransferase family 2 protein [Marinilabiliaceae bacterium ANBcel2]|nr:glycosyltransferase family 2 protein [Marinilabiliaceae bacterium ANBcel2]